MPNKTEIVKNIVGVVVGFGVSSIVKAIASNNTDPQKMHEQISITCGSYVLGMMVADEAKKYTDAWIDSIIEKWNETAKARQKK